MQSPASKLRFSTLCGTILVAAVFASAERATAQDSGVHPVDSALEMMDLKTQAGPMPDFVSQSRGAQSDNAYIPVGAKPPTRGLKPKSAADVKALTAELDAARDAQLAGKRPKPMSSGTPTPKKAAGKPLELKPGAAQATNR